MGLLPSVLLTNAEALDEQMQELMFWEADLPSPVSPSFLILMTFNIGWGMILWVMKGGGGEDISPIPPGSSTPTMQKTVVYTYVGT